MRKPRSVEARRATERRFVKISAAREISIRKVRLSGEPRSTEQGQLSGEGRIIEGRHVVHEMGAGEIKFGITPRAWGVESFMFRPPDPAEVK